MPVPKSVAIAIFSPNNQQILLIQRRDIPVWVLPGGGIDPGESSLQAAQRETQEETGLEVSHLRFVGEYHPINRLARCTHLYTCNSFQGTLSQSPETRDVCFFDLQKLPPLPPPYAEWIEDSQTNHFPCVKKLLSVNYRTLIKYTLLHPILVFRFFLSRLGLHWNSD